MEGTLQKWTNYLSGWQPRWFVLDGGTLSYYDSQEDARKGCKGSIKISACEIQVHPSDTRRVDLTVPGQQYFYLRAINTAERQRWLVAMGTAKACLTDNRTRIEKELQENAEALRTKMSELRLYCDLLCQQVSRIRESALPEELSAAVEDGGDMNLQLRPAAPHPLTPATDTITFHKVSAARQRSPCQSEQGALLKGSPAETTPSQSEEPRPAEEDRPGASGAELAEGAALVNRGGEEQEKGGFEEEDSTAVSREQEVSVIQTEEEQSVGQEVMSHRWSRAERGSILTGHTRHPGLQD
ncbi:hypothetical protein AAFF_G00265030 [Aldrovandia affinis]|uniref:PH domain-containing protein n=1 Tax=Aldrovandia affinis TaxID=143900 RepID=A0AAD7RC61_9TELE|nr:hypothetical protein AAFF_G00265030 [Aldrovandia affinis]